MIARPGELGDDDKDDSVPVVAFLPFICPKCGQSKPFTAGVRGRIRWHRCKNCGLSYKSRELRGIDEIDEFRGRSIG